LTLAAVALMASPAMALVTPSANVNTGPNTQQYHSYDGLICNDCHTLHASEDGAAVDGDRISGTWQDNSDGNGSLLFKGDFTDMCLSCHKQGYNQASTADLPSVSLEYGDWTAPIVMTTDGVDPLNVAMPAGDFYFSNNDPKKGHNPAFTKGSMATATSTLMAADPDLGSTPPGNQGSWVEAEWSCHSCHGMHSRFSGTYTAYRQIKRKINGIVHTGNETVAAGVETSGGISGATTAGYEPIKSNTRGDIVGTDYLAQRGDTDDLDGASLFADESDTNKNVYRGGFSSMCATCHGDFHGGNDSSKAVQNTNVRSADGYWLKHPTNLAMNDGDIKAKYGVNPGDGTVGGYNVAVINADGGTPNPIGYDWKYPLVVDDANTGGVLPDAASAASATTLTGDERIMCLTCHKAHASQFENMTRWDVNTHAFLADGETDFTGETNTEGDNPAYGCGKCHQKGGRKAYVKGF
jgi:hypothetical protein